MTRLQNNYRTLCRIFYLSIYLSVCLSVYLSIYLFVNLSISIYRSIYLSIYLSSLSINISVILSICSSTYLSLYLSVCLSFCLSTYHQPIIYLSMRSCVIYMHKIYKYIIYDMLVRYEYLKVLLAMLSIMITAVYLVIPFT